MCACVGRNLLSSAFLIASEAMYIPHSLLCISTYKYICRYVCIYTHVIVYLFEFLLSFFIVLAIFALSLTFSLEINCFKCAYSCSNRYFIYIHIYTFNFDKYNFDATLGRPFIAACWLALRVLKRYSFCLVFLLIFVEQSVATICARKC